MAKVRIDKLKGNEVLSKHVLSESGIELISAGTMLKKEYIERLQLLNIDEVEVVDVPDKKQDDSFDLFKEVVKEESKKVVKDVLEKHIYKNSADLTELCEVADDIINNVMSEEEIINQVTNIKQSSSDIYTHSINVCALSTVLALKAGYSKEIVSDIAKGSILHDIGLRCIVVPYENQDINELPLKNQVEFKKHVIYGYDSVKNVDWLSELSKNIVLLHHERNNGAGYPFKNHGSSISDPIKMVAVCDTFDCLISGIGYKQLKVHQAIEYMKALSVDALEDTYVDLLLQMVAMYPVGTKIITNEGERGEVIRQNKGYIDRPVLKITHDSAGNKLETSIYKDMTKVLTIFIDSVIDE